MCNSEVVLGCRPSL